MGATDWQLGVKDESTYATRVTVDRFFEYESESIADQPMRTEGDPLRTGSAFLRNDRFLPYYGGASGNVQMAVMNKGFGFWLKHMLGTVGTTGPSSSYYTHTGTEGSLVGDSFTMQLNRPFHPAGTNQAITFGGGKVTEWTLSNSVDGNLLADLGLDFANQTTGTALATASYPSSMENLTWAGAVISIGGSAYDVTEFSVGVNNGYNVDRRQLRGNTEKKEPTSSRRTATFSLKADFDSLTNRNRALSDTRSGALAAISAVWTLGSASLTVTIPAGKFDTWAGATAGVEAIEQELTGECRYDGTNSPISVQYVSLDTAP